MTKINLVNTTQMRNIASEIEQMTHDYSQQVAALYQEGRELDTYWSGDAKKAFDARLGNDQPKFDTLNNVVKQYIEAARIFAKRYDDNEIEVGQIGGS